MRLPLRPVIGFSAAFGTMAFVLSAAMLTPQPQETHSAKATCPNSARASAEAHASTQGVTAFWRHL